MPLLYKVIVNFKFIKGKPQLSSLSLVSIYSTWDELVIYPTLGKPLEYYRKFHTLAQAQDYISYLYKVYPNSPVPPPILDGGQQLLFNLNPSCWGISL